MENNKENKCKICGQVVDKLYGLFVPYACQECYKKKREEAIARRDYCLKCGKLRMECCC